MCSKKVNGSYEVKLGVYKINVSSWLRQSQIHKGQLAAQAQ